MIIIFWTKSQETSIQNLHPFATSNSSTQSCRSRCRSLMGRIRKSFRKLQHLPVSLCIWSLAYRGRFPCSHTPSCTHSNRKFSPRLRQRLVCTHLELCAFVVSYVTIQNVIHVTMWRIRFHVACYGRRIGTLKFYVKTLLWESKLAIYWKVLPRESAERKQQKRKLRIIALDKTHRHNECELRTASMQNRKVHWNTHGCHASGYQQ